MRSVNMSSNPRRPQVEFQSANLSAARSTRQEVKSLKRCPVHPLPRSLPPLALFLSLFLNWDRKPLSQSQYWGWKGGRKERKEGRKGRDCLPTSLSDLWASQAADISLCFCCGVPYQETLKEKKLPGGPESSKMWRDSPPEKIIGRKDMLLSAMKKYRRVPVSVFLTQNKHRSVFGSPPPLVARPRPILLCTLLTAWLFRALDWKDDFGRGTWLIVKLESRMVRITPKILHRRPKNAAVAIMERGINGTPTPDIMGFTE